MTYDCFMGTRHRQCISCTGTILLYLEDHQRGDPRIAGL